VITKALIHEKGVTPGPNVIKLLTITIDQARVFVLGRPFQHNQLLVSLARVYPSEALLRCSNVG
jgi:hypothetical protein